MIKHLQLIYTKVKNNLLTKINYKLFKLWKKKQYKKFFKESNWDFDHSSITFFLELKLTIMGLQFAKFGIVVEEDRKKQVRSIWQARKYIKNYINAFDWAQEYCQNIFREKYNCDYTYRMFLTPYDKNMSTLNFECTSKVENKEDADDFWKSLNELGVEYDRERDQLKKAFDYIFENIFSWWD